MKDMLKKIIQSIEKRIFIPVGFKLIFIISLLIIISLSSMILLASYFFKDDSSVRIEENNHTISEVIALKVESDILSIIGKANLISTSIIENKKRYKRSAAGIDNYADRYFNGDKDLLFVAVTKKGKRGRLKVKTNVFNTPCLEENRIEKRNIWKALRGEKKVFRKSFNNEEVVINTSTYFKRPVIGISVPYIRNTETTASSVLVIFITMNRFLEAVKTRGIARTSIVNGSGDLIAHYDPLLILAKASLANLPIVKRMMISPADNEQKRFKDEDGIKYIGSFKKVNFGGIGVITIVEESTAFAAVLRIERRNFLILIIVLTLSILILYFFAKTLTVPVRRLVEGTKEIENGNFELDLEKTTRDEIGLLTESFVDMGRGLAEREKMKEAFGRFVNKEIAEMVLKDEIKLGGEKKEAVIFFSDIRSFTSMSEKLEPEEVVEFLNEYMTEMVDCIYKTHGVVDKFIGDAIMATWGTPISRGNDTENAINSALYMRKRLIEFNSERGTKRRPVIRHGCGINTGPVLAGQIGSHDRMEYTVIGDAVNLASRIEFLNKPFGTDILISENSYKMVKGIFSVKKMQKITVKGKKDQLQIYAVLGRKDDNDAPKSIKALQKILCIEQSELEKYKQEETKYEIID